VDQPGARRFKPCIWCTQPVEVGTDVCGFCRRSQARTRYGLIVLFAVLGLLAIAAWARGWFF
jgi:predicted nucleic acid-binding Zn ribbon protein